jgi:hypothetical protein
MISKMTGSSSEMASNTNLAPVKRDSRRRICAMK